MKSVMKVIVTAATIADITPFVNDSAILETPITLPALLCFIAFSTFSTTW